MGDPLEAGATHCTITLFAMTEVVGEANTAGINAHNKLISLE